MGRPDRTTHALLLSALPEHLHAHANGSGEHLDALLRPLPHSRHSGRSSFRWSTPGSANTSDGGGGSPTVPLSPAESFCQLCESLAHGDDATRSAGAVGVRGARVRSC